MLTKRGGTYTHRCTSDHPTPFRVSGRSEKINEINLLREEALELPPGPPFPFLGVGFPFGFFLFVRAICQPKKAGFLLFP